MGATMFTFLLTQLAPLQALFKGFSAVQNLLGLDGQCQGWSTSCNFVYNPKVCGMANTCSNTFHLAPATQDNVHSGLGSQMSLTKGGGYTQTNAVGTLKG